MKVINESGHYAIAGFLFQLIGSGVEAIEVCTSLQSDEGQHTILVLERFGQDAAAMPVDGSNAKPRLIQYKFSSNDETIAPSELREILQVMLNSVRSGGLVVDQVDYTLVTNRGYSPIARKWQTAESVRELAKLIKKSSRSDVADASELATIFRKLKYERRTEADFRQEIVAAGARFGVLESEIDARIHELVGLLLFRAREPGSRIVRPSQIHRALTGYDDPYALLSTSSIEMRRNEVERFKHDQTGGRETILRTVSNDIAKAVLEHPVVVVVGDGGCGKSVAVADAVISGLQSKDEPPGFGMVLPALIVSSEAMMQSVARWRKLLQHNDSHNLERALERLRHAFARNPLLVICVEAIDERDGQARLPNESQQFIRSMIDNAIRQHSEHGMPETSVVLTCRRKEELDRLTGGAYGFSQNYYSIYVADFDDQEMERLATRILDSGVRQRIEEHLRTRASVVGRAIPTATRPVSSDVRAVITHPVIWRFFSELNCSAQHAVLDGSTIGFDQLAELYLKWFCSKAEIRNNFENEECRTALIAVAQRFDSNTARIADRASDWTKPCIDSGCSNKNANQLFSEAMTAGVLADDEAGGRRWRWRHGWFCDYLSRQ